VTPDTRNGNGNASRNSRAKKTGAIALFACARRHVLAREKRPSFILAIAREIWTPWVTLRGCITVNGSSNGDPHQKPRSTSSPCFSLTLSLSLSLFTARARGSNTDILRTRQGRKFSTRCLSPQRVYSVLFIIPARLYPDCARDAAHRALKRAIKPYRGFNEGICTSGLLWAGSRLANADRRNKGAIRNGGGTRNGGREDLKQRTARDAWQGH